MHKQRTEGFAVAIAWPETYCKQPGSWYDPITGWLGINKHNYYRAGHAALVLVDIENQKCHYFDFGRYHAPFQHGRVRSAGTDFDLEMKTAPEISGDRSTIENFHDILFELQTNPACHGEGSLFASYCPVDFKDAFEKALSMQKESPLPYGPFRIGGSNCSRFVNKVIFAGKPALKYRFNLKYLVPFTPTPLNNVNSLGNKKIIPKMLDNEPFCPAKGLESSLLRSTLARPERHPAIPEDALWLSGEGAGSWFVIDVEGGTIKITRYSPAGVVECMGHFLDREGASFIPDDSIRLGYPSNCKEVILHKGQEVFRLERISS